MALVGPIVLAILVFAIVGSYAAVIASKRRRPRSAIAVADGLAERAIGRAEAAAGAEPWLPASAADAPDGAAAIEAALIAGDGERALAAAEACVAAAPDAAAPRIWLAWALCASAEPAAALVQLETARRIARADVGAAEPASVADGAGAPAASVVDGPLARYVEARATHLVFERATGAAAAGAIPPLVTAGDLAIVTLAGAQGGAAWLSGAQEAQVSPVEISTATAEHRELTARAWALALDALDVAPGFADALYLAARLAVKSGALPAARALFDAAKPRMAGRPDNDSFARDLADLDDPSGAVAAALRAPPPAVPPTAKRSRRLNVL